MNRNFRSVAVLMRSLMIVALFVTTAWADRAADQAAFQQSLMPMLRAYCYDCHDTGSDIPLLEDDSLTKLQSHRKLWVRALAQVRLGSMPPADGEKMDAKTREKMVALIDGLANSVNCVENPNAGKVALRRLNRHEYRNTVRDLTGVDYQPSTGFPGDDVGYSFDNIGDVLSLPPILFEKYLDAAEYISGKAIYTPPPAEIFELDRAPSNLIGAEKYHTASRLTMASRGTVSLLVEPPFAGMFTLTVTASGEQGGDEPVKMQIQLG